ncbi:Integrase catalytic domain-containing protein [Rhabdochlamydiaceae symbiont of Dictyostelium giganteum]
MRAIDEEYLKHLYCGRRRMAIAMKHQGFNIGQKAVRTAMQMMGLEAIYPKPNLSISSKKFKKFPYLLRNRVIDKPDQTWAADITYIPLLKGFGYLFAIIDWFSRYVIAWELSNVLDTEFCLEALQRGLKNRSPEIFNTDQGVQFTSLKFTNHLEKKGIKISMDGKGRALDNVFVERLWRSVKYEDIYLKGYESLKEVKVGLKDYFNFYNEDRPHQGLKYQTPSAVYFGTSKIEK